MVLVFHIVRRLGVRPTRCWREVDSNYRFPDAPVMPRELESRELLDADPANPLGVRVLGSAARNRKFADSPLEEERFEPSVPPSRVALIATRCRIGKIP